MHRANAQLKTGMAANQACGRAGVFGSLVD
jgi:hypothetical protein